jgi:hypothetical protein
MPPPEPVVGFFWQTKTSPKKQVMIVDTGNPFDDPDRRTILYDRGGNPRPIKLMDFYDTFEPVVDFPKRKRKPKVQKKPERKSVWERIGGKDWL